MENGGWASTVDRGETASGDSKEYRFAVSLQRIAERATIDEATWRSTCPVSVKLNHAAPEMNGGQSAPRRSGARLLHERSGLVDLDVAAFERLGA